MVKLLRKVKKVLRDRRGDTSTVFKMVLTITIIAAILVILLFILQSAQVGGSRLTGAMNETASQLNSSLTNFTKN